MDFSRRVFLIAASAGVLTSGFSQTAWAQVLPSALNALDFGVETGGGNQSAALQRAIDEAASKQMPLFLPGGDYAASNIQLPTGLQFFGVPGQTTLSYNGGGGLLSANGARNVSLRGLVLKGNMLDLSGSALFVAQDATGLSLEDCRIFDSSANCISLRNVSGKISNCELARARKAALFSIDTDGLIISANHVHDCDNNGILVWRSQSSEDGTIVTQNRIENIATVDGGSGQNGNGINIFRAHNVIASQNRISDCAFSAVRSNAGSACQIIGNSCSRIKEVALYAEFGFAGAVIAQNIVEDAAAGVSITNFNDGGRLGVCANNIIRNLFVREGEKDLRGIGVGVEADTLVTGNLVENAPRIGIALGWGKYMRDVSATNNIVRTSRIGIAASISLGAGKALIANNLISGSKTHAIAGFDYGKTLPQELMESNNAAAFDNLTISGNVVS